MIATPAERLAFGKHLLALRKGAGLTQVDLKEALEAEGTMVSDAAIGNWEAGKNAPRDTETVRQLEWIFRAPGELTPLLGIRSPEDRQSTEDRLSDLEKRFARIEALLEDRLG